MVHIHCHLSFCQPQKLKIRHFQGIGCHDCLEFFPGPSLSQSASFTTWSLLLVPNLNSMVPSVFTYGTPLVPATGAAAAGVAGAASGGGDVSGTAQISDLCISLALASHSRRLKLL